MLCAMWQISVAARLFPSLEHQEAKNIWQVAELCEEKGEPKKKKKNVNSCLPILFFVNLWMTVYMCRCACVCVFGVSL